MKIRPGKRKSVEGNIILICIIFSVVLGITIASYLSLVQSQYNITLRSHGWNTAMVLAEAGVEDGMSFINKYAGNYANTQNWADTAVADGWTVNGNVYHTQRTPDPTLGVYDVWVTNDVTSISVCAVGSAMWNQVPITGPQVPTAAPGVATSGNGSGAIVRQVLVQATNAPLFCAALASTGYINLNGYTINADSFDSEDPGHSAWNTNLQYGFYTKTLRKTGGLLATDGNIYNAGPPGDTLIYGSISTGPGGDTNLEMNGSVGDATWVPTLGIQPGHAQDDMNVVFQNVQLPPGTPSQIGPILSKYTIPATGYYEDSSDNAGLAHSLTIEATNVVLYLPNGVNYGNYAGFEPPFGYTGYHSITVTNGSATLYAADEVNLGPSGNIVNTTGNAADLTIYGLSSLTNLNLTSVSNFVGTIYAPQADIILGSNAYPTQIIGSCIARSITLNGNVTIHYDENLARVGPIRAYVPVSWTEF